MDTNIDGDAQQRREVFARFGLAVYHAQCLERQVGIMLSTRFFRDFGTSSPEQRDAKFDEAFSRTFGALLKELEKTITIPPNLGRKLQMALQKRNWLAHDYFYDRSGHLLSREGRDKMIEELTDLGKQFDEVDDHLTSITERWAEKMGLTPDIIQSHMERLIEAGKTANAEVSLQRSPE
jgi:hypothetical protein